MSEALRTPHENAIQAAISFSKLSPCQSKRGAVVFDSNGYVRGGGYNYKPRGFDCDGSEACKATCRDEAVHAEQQVLLALGRRSNGADLLHVKTVKGVLVASGGPSCVQCSKLAVAAGIAGVWLYHEHGWQRYEASEFHRLSLVAVAARAPQEPPNERQVLVAAAQLWLDYIHGRNGFTDGTRVGEAVAAAKAIVAQWAAADGRDTPPPTEDTTNAKTKAERDRDMAPAAPNQERADGRVDGAPDRGSTASNTPAPTGHALSFALGCLSGTPTPLDIQQARGFIRDALDALAGGDTPPRSQDERIAKQLSGPTGALSHDPEHRDPAGEFRSQAVVVGENSDARPTDGPSSHPDLTAGDTPQEPPRLLRELDGLIGMLEECIENEEFMRALRVAGGGEAVTDDETPMPFARAFKDHVVAFRELHKKLEAREARAVPSLDRIMAVIEDLVKVTDTYGYTGGSRQRAVTLLGELLRADPALPQDQEAT